MANQDSFWGTEVGQEIFYLKIFTVPGQYHKWNLNSSWSFLSKKVFRLTFIKWLKSILSKMYIIYTTCKNLMQLTVCNCFNISFTVMQEEKRPLKKISRSFSILNSANFLFQYCAYFYFRIWRMQFILIKVKISINYSCHIKAESEYQKYRKLALNPSLTTKYLLNIVSQMFFCGKKNWC